MLELFGRALLLQPTIRRSIVRLTKVTFNVYHNGTLDDATILGAAQYWLESMDISLDDDHPDAEVNIPDTDVVVHTAPFDIE